MSLHSLYARYLPINIINGRRVIQVRGRRNTQLQYRQIPKEQACQIAEFEREDAISITT